MRVQFITRVNNAVALVKEADSGAITYFEVKETTVGEAGAGHPGGVFGPVTTDITVWLRGKIKSTRSPRASTNHEHT